jgi:hypothetical protein
MNIIKYFISKSYRLKVKNEYTKELCSKVELEQRQTEKAFSSC